MHSSVFEDRNVIRICDKWNIVLSLVAFIAAIAAGAVEVVFGLLVSVPAELGMKLELICI